MSDCKKISNKNIHVVMFLFLYGLSTNYTTMIKVKCTFTGKIPHSLKKTAFNAFYPSRQSSQRTRSNPMIACHNYDPFTPKKIQPHFSRVLRFLTFHFHFHKAKTMKNLKYEH